jgi:hypothetical protein
VPTSTPTSLGSQSKFKLSAVVDQIVDDEITFLPNPELQVMNNRFSLAMGSLPDPEEACTEEQISAMAHLLASGRPPCADFSIWGPHGTRLLRRSKIQGLKMDVDGHFRSVEFFGPESSQCGRLRTQSSQLQ